MKSTIVQDNSWHTGTGIEWTGKKSYCLEEGEEVGDDRTEWSSAMKDGRASCNFTRSCRWWNAGSTPTLWTFSTWGLVPQWFSDKESTCDAGDREETGSIPGSGKFPGGRNDNPLLSLARKSHGQRILAGYSPRGWKRVRLDIATEHTLSHIHTHWPEGDLLYPTGHFRMTFIQLFCIWITGNFLQLCLFSLIFWGSYLTT